MNEKAKKSTLNPSPLEPSSPATIGRVTRRGYLIETILTPQDLREKYGKASFMIVGNTSKTAKTPSSDTPPRP